MSGFNVETYEIFKKKNSTANEANYDNLSNRVTVLENNLMSINSTFTYDFSNDDYIDFYKSTVTMTSKGIIPKQYLKTTFIDFNKDDSYVDYDNSSDIKWQDNQILLNSTSVLTGTLRLSSIDVDKAVGMRFDCDYKNKDSISSISPQDIRDGNLWFVSEVDNFGRLWVISSEQFSCGTTNKAHVNIFNTDGTIYKSFDLENKALFGSTDTVAAYPMFGSGMKFTDENIAVIVTRTHPAYRNGGNPEGNVNNDYYDFNTFMDKVILINDHGDYNVLGYYSGQYVRRYYTADFGGFSKPDIFTDADYIYIQTGSYTEIMDFDNSYLNTRYKNFIAFKITGSLATSLTNIELVKQMYRGSFPRTTGNEPGNYKYTHFRSSNAIYNPDGKEFYYTFGQSKDYIFDSNYISQICSMQVGINYVDKVFNSEGSVNDINFVPLNPVSDKIVIYNHPGFNGMFYASNGRLYIFGNDTSTNKALLNCYIPDWTSRKSGKLNVNNTISKTMNLQTNSLCIPARGGNYPFADCPNYNIFTQYMKVIEYDNKLHLVYFAPLSDTTRTLCLKYMSFDYDLNQVIEETVLWQQTDKKFTICDYDVEIFNGDLLIIYSLGNPNDFTSSNTASKIYSIKIGKVTSNIKFYYLDDVKRIWTNINSGDEAKFESPVSKITMKAVLESDTYNCSPTINSMTIQTWNNNNGTSRQSEYYSKRIDEVQDDGKGVLSADYEENDGVIDWFVSYDGGNNYNKINLNEEFIFTHLDAPDFRVKAVMSVTDNAKKLPIIHSYTLKTNSLVLHSDLEEIQINLIKTNFKIDTYTKASKNGLMKMTIDTLSDENFIDQKKSNYTFYNSYGYAGGVLLQTKPEEVSEKVGSILLSVDEICENPNSKIVYSASADGGATFKEIKPNVKTQLTNTNSEKDQIVMKAVFYEGAKLNAWGWAWD
jgi:hypothetical protein